MIVDYHMHLRDPDERIDHTVEAIERFVETAAARGVDEIGFTEHVYYFSATRPVWTLPYQTERCVYDLDRYVEAVLEAKRRGFPVKLGLEVDYVGERQDELAALLEPYPWDLLLGSVHWIDGLAVDQEPGIWAAHSVEEVWRRYFAALAELAGSGHVDVLAHPDLAKIFGRRPDRPVLVDLWFETAEAIGNRVAFEVSTAGLRKPVGEIYPDEGLLVALAHGGAVLTLASDAHVPGLVGYELGRAIDLVREAGGAPRLAVFEGRRRRDLPWP
jgi:histidinol-phosphatase (PHP family)